MTDNDLVIKNFLSRLLKNYDNYMLFLFWSRARWDNKKNSDYDIWFIWNKKINFKDYLRIKSELDELPYLIDFVDFSRTDENFKKIALNNIKIWKKKNYNYI